MRAILCLASLWVAGLSAHQLNAQATTFLLEEAGDSVVLSEPSAMADAIILAMPACADQGKSKAAFSVPPGRDRDEFRTSLASSDMFPSGTEFYLFPVGSGPRLLNQEEISIRTGRLLQKFFLANLQIEGLLVVLLHIDEDGRVRQVSSNVRNDEVDEGLDQLWRRAAFEPFAFGGCRSLAWYHVPMNFRPNAGPDGSGTQIDVGDQPRRAR